MLKTSYQPPELWNDNNQIFRSGAYGKNTDFCNLKNNGIIDYINNNLEWLYDNKLNSGDLNNSVNNMISVQTGFDKTNLSALLTSLSGMSVKCWADYNSANYSPSAANGFWRYLGLSGGGAGASYTGLLAVNTQSKEMFMSSGYSNAWTQVETVIEQGDKYVRYASGVQICFESISGVNTNTVSGYNFPAPFKTAPRFIGSCNANLFVYATSLTATGCTIQIPNNSASRALQVIAIGRWK